MRAYTAQELERMRGWLRQAVTAAFYADGFQHTPDASSIKPEAEDQLRTAITASVEPDDLIANCKKVMTDNGITPAY